MRADSIGYGINSGRQGNNYELQIADCKLKIGICNLRYVLCFNNLNQGGVINTESQAGRRLNILGFPSRLFKRR